VVVTLLGRGADPKAQDKGGFMPHHDAASKGQLNTLRVLLQDKRTPINEGVHDGLTALHMASSEDKEGVIKLLIGFGADVEKRSYVVSLDRQSACAVMQTAQCQSVLAICQ